eukprot:351427-Chlamydomonas_euryale.AAC.1
MGSDRFLSVGGSGLLFANIELLSSHWSRAHWSRAHWSRSRAHWSWAHWSRSRAHWSRSRAHWSRARWSRVTGKTWGHCGLVGWVGEGRGLGFLFALCEGPHLGTSRGLFWLFCQAQVMGVGLEHARKEGDCGAQVVKLACVCKQAVL